MVTIFVPDIPELSPLVDAARRGTQCQIEPPRRGYWRITAPREVRFRRDDLGLTHALWNSALSGGFCGRIVEYTSDALCVASED
jgi:hypothetical protein